MTGGHMQLAHRGPACNIVQSSEHKVQLGRYSDRSVWTIVIENSTLLNKNGSHLMLKCTEDTNLKAAARQMCATRAGVAPLYELNRTLQLVAVVTPYTAGIAECSWEKDCYK